MLEYPMLTLLVIAPFAEKVQQAERQREAVEAIRELGGNVRYDYQFDKAGSLMLEQEPPGPAWLRALVGDDFFADVLHVSFFMAPKAAEVNDVVFEHVKPLRRLEWLRLRGTQITDPGLLELNRLTELVYLDLSGTHVTDAGLNHLRGLI